MMFAILSRGNRARAILALSLSVSVLSCGDVFVESSEVLCFQTKSDVVDPDWNPKFAFAMGGAVFSAKVREEALLVSEYSDGELTRRHRFVLESFPDGSRICIDRPLLYSDASVLILCQDKEGFAVVEFSALGWFKELFVGPVRGEHAFLVLQDGNPTVLDRTHRFDLHATGRVFESQLEDCVRYPIASGARAMFFDATDAIWFVDGGQQVFRAKGPVTMAESIGNELLIASSTSYNRKLYLECVELRPTPMRRWIKRLPANKSPWRMRRCGNRVFVWNRDGKEFYEVRCCGVAKIEWQRPIDYSSMMWVFGGPDENSVLVTFDQGYVTLDLSTSSPCPTGAFP